MSYAVEIIMAPSRIVAVTRFHVGTAELRTMGEKMPAAFGTVIAHLGLVGVTPLGPAVACYEPAEDGFDVSAGFLVTEPFTPGDEVGVLELAAGEVAHTTHLGSYEQLSTAYDALRAGVEAQGRTLADDAVMWEEYWSGPDTPPEQTRTEVYWPVLRA